MIITYIADESSNTLMAQLPICKIIRHLTLVVMGGWGVILDPACVSLSLPVNTKPAK